MLGVLLFVIVFGAISPNRILDSNLEYDSQTLASCLRIITKNKGLRTTVITNPEVELNTYDLDSSILRTDFKHLNLMKHFKSISINVIMKIETLGDFNKTLHVIQHYIDHTNSNYIFIFSEKDKTSLLELFGLIWKSKLRNFVVLVKDNIKIELYVLDLINWQCGTKAFPRLLSTCDGQIMTHSLTFPEKFYKHFIGCQFRVIWSLSPPWILSRNQSYPGGVHIEILNIFKQVSQMDLIYMPKNEAYEKELQENYGFESLLRDFNTGYADVYAGLTSYFGSVPVEKTFITDNKLYFAMPKPIQIPYWKTFLMIFNWRYCLIRCVILFLVSLFIEGLSKKHVNNQLSSSFTMSLLNSYALSLGMAIHKFPSSMKLKLFLCKYFSIKILTYKKKYIKT